jgi:hypothetical protein
VFRFAIGIVSLAELNRAAMLFAEFQVFRLNYAVVTHFCKHATIRFQVEMLWDANLEFPSEIL